jgi:hypothetical protein
MPKRGINLNQAHPGFLPLQRRRRFARRMDSAADASRYRPERISSSIRVAARSAADLVRRVMLTGASPLMGIRARHMPEGSFLMDAMPVIMAGNGD